LTNRTLDGLIEQAECAEVRGALSAPLRKLRVAANQEGMIGKGIMVSDAQALRVAARAF
jgi:hypothetical protein